MRRWNKKATLSISIGAIVVIVIAFVVLGLGLTLTQTIFGGAKEKIPEIFAITKLGQEPTAEIPLTVPDAIDINRKSEKELEVGFYNKDIETHYNVSINVKTCKSVTTGEDIIETPVVTSLDQNVGASDGIGYKIVLKEQGLAAGRYVCVVTAEGPASLTEPTIMVWESKQIFLRVVT